MDPFVFGLVALVGASAAAISRLRRARAGDELEAKAARPVREDRSKHGDGWAAVGDVLSHLGEDYWLAGELVLVREGAPVLRVFKAPEKGADRWVALTADGKSVWFLDSDSDLHALGWPGVEVRAKGKILRRAEHGPVAVTTKGEAPEGWEGMGRFAIFRSLDGVALVLEGPTRDRIAMVGSEVPRSLVQKMG